jgi:sugar/nucleoside kinase (ribokinase family)
MTIAIIANAPMNLVVSVDNSFLAEFGFTKMICTPLDWDRAELLENSIERINDDFCFSPGGCGANIAVWLKMLGIAPTLIAPFGLDINGRLARCSIAELQINCLGYNYDGAQSRTYTLITNDKERTFASVQGPVPTNILADILPYLANEPYFLVDSYYLEHDGAIEIMMPFLRRQRAIGKKFVFCPNDTSVISRHEYVMEELIDLSDILLMNENEAEALFVGTSSLNVINQLRARGKSGAITDGPLGARVFDASGIYDVPPAKPPRAQVNTNGAGDAFAAGFLAGILLDFDLRWSGELGRYCAAEILTTTSARPDVFQAQAVLQKLEQERKNL